MIGDERHIVVPTVDFQATFVAPLAQLTPRTIGGDAFAYRSIHTGQEFVSVWGLLFSAEDLKGPFGYELRLSGYLDYNPKTGRITRFEFVALGDTYGYPNTDDAAWKPSWRAGRQPLGVAFEMISGATAGERIPARVVPPGP
jgi:hypothetical protein